MKTRIVAFVAAAVVAVPLNITAYNLLDGSRPALETSEANAAAKGDASKKEIEKARALVEKRKQEAEAVKKALAAADAEVAQAQTALDDLAETAALAQSEYEATRSDYERASVAHQAAQNRLRAYTLKLKAWKDLLDLRRATLASARSQQQPTATIARLQAAVDKASTSRQKFAGLRAGAYQTQTSTKAALKTATAAQQTARNTYVEAQAAYETSAAYADAAVARQEQALAARLAAIEARDQARAALAKLLGKQPPSPSNDDDVTQKSRNLRVGTFNVYFGISQSAAAQVTQRFLKEADLDILALQEYQSRQAAVGQLRNAGYKVVTGKGGDPVVWDPEEFSVRSTSTYQYSRAEYVGFVTGARTKAWTRDHWVNVVRLQDRKTGATISFTSVHMPAHVLSAGRPKPGASAARLDNRRDAEKNLQQILRRELDRSDYVFAAGDWNTNYKADRAVLSPFGTEYHMRPLGLSSNFKNDPPNMPTIGASVFDHIYANTPATSSRVMDGQWLSDHRPVLAVYEIKNR